MISIRKYALGLAFLLVIAAGSAARAQTGEGTIYGVTNLDVAPDATNQAIALLKQYRDAALKQAGNAGVIILQEAGWPNRFVIYETRNDQSAYDTRPGQEAVDQSHYVICFLALRLHTFLLLNRVLAMDPDHLKLLEKGVEAWNAWRERDIEGPPSIFKVMALSEADLRETDLQGVNLSVANLRGADISWASLFQANLAGADLRGANLSETILNQANLNGANLVKTRFRRAELNGANLNAATLREADLRGASLCEASLFHVHLAGADLRRTDLRRADLSGAELIKTRLRKAKLGEAKLGRADLRGADLRKADLSGANLSGANLSGVDLTYGNLVDADLTGADLTGCRIYGISAWGLKLDQHTKQQNLIITPGNQPDITVDNIEVAQFVYLLLHNEKIRDAIDTIGKKGVLLLGRFTGGRIAILERLREELRKRDFLPIIFNFDKTETKDFTEAVRLLAGMSRFVIVDITNPRSARSNYRRPCPNT